MRETVIKLSSKQKTQIRMGLKDIEEGRTISHQKAKKEMFSWFDAHTKQMISSDKK
ncbi:MAG: hypothetical protein ABI772_12410 [Bacteroidota bacterium]